MSKYGTGCLVRNGVAFGFVNDDGQEMFVIYREHEPDTTLPQKQVVSCLQDVLGVFKYPDVAELPDNDFKGRMKKMYNSISTNIGVKNE